MEESFLDSACHDACFFQLSGLPAYRRGVVGEKLLHHLKLKFSFFSVVDDLKPKERRFIALLSSAIRSALGVFSRLYII